MNLHESNYADRCALDALMWRQEAFGISERRDPLLLDLYDCVWPDGSGVCTSPSITRADVEHACSRSFKRGIWDTPHDVRMLFCDESIW